LKVPPVIARPQRSMLRNLGEGLRYVWTFPTISALLILAAIPSIFGQPYLAMLPAVAVGILHTDATGLGFLQSVAGAGALVGALTMASVTKSSSRSRMQMQMLFGFGLALMLFGLSRWMPLSLLFIFGVGIASMSYSAINQTFIQHVVDDEMRGRVMSIYALSTLGLQPVGALLIGAVGSVIGVGYALLIGGAVCLALSLISTRFKQAKLEAL